MPIKWDDIVHGAAGAADEVLFGAPEWLLKNLGDRKAVQAWIDKNPKAYHTGETIGTIGGALIPVGGIAKGIGLGAKALKGAKAAETGLELAKGAGTLGKLAEGANIAGRVGEAAKGASALSDIGRMATKSAGLGALESGVRGAFDEESGDQISKDVSRGLLFGGLGGATAGALSKAAPYISRLGKKATEKATIGLTNANTRGLLQTAQRMAGEGSGPMAQVRKVDDLRGEISDLIKSKKLWKEGAVEKAAQEQKDIWDALDNVYEKVAGGKTGAEVLGGALDANDLATLSKRYDPETLAAATEAIRGPVANRTGLANIRDKLESVAKAARVKGTGNAEIDNATYEMAKMIRGKLDDAVVETAKASGINIPPNFKHEYGLLMPIAKGEVRSELAPTKFNLGSPTFEKAAAASLLGGGSSLLGGKDEPIEEKLKRAALGATLGFAGSKALGGLARKAVSSADTLAGLAQRAAPAIAEAAPDIATAGGRLAANTANAVEAAQPTTEPELEAAKAGAEAGQATPKEYMGLVLNRLKQYAASEGIAEDSPDFEDFVNYVGQNTQGDEGPFDAKKLAGILYPDPDERSKFVKALDVSRGLKSSLGSALRPMGGVMGIGEDVGARMERETALDRLSALVGDVGKATGTEKAAKAQLQRILSARGLSQSAKKEMIRGLLEGYGIDFDTLARVGINV
jgi:hypothetical protein